MLSIERMAEHVVNILHASVSAYNKKFERTFFCGNDRQESILDFSEELKKKLCKVAVEDRPVIYTESECLDFGLFKNEGLVWIIGPVCCNYDGKTVSKTLKENFTFPENYKPNIPNTDIKIFVEIFSVFAETKLELNKDYTQILMESFAGKDGDKKIQSDYNKVFNSLLEDNKIHNPYSQELIEQSCIENGDLEGLKKSFEIIYEGQLGKLANNPLRSTKNLAITVCTLASRSAIRGGVNPEEVFSMSDAYIQSMERLSSEGQILKSIRAFEEKLTTLVAEKKMVKTTNPVVIKCMAVVREQLYSQPTVEKIAEEMFFAKDYLARLFKRETGKKLSDYIRETKIDEAKRMLIFTDEDYKQIALILGFSSQSHFISVFKKTTGRTPQQFRKSVKVLN